MTMASADKDPVVGQKIERLLSSQAPGRSLTQPFYTDADMFRQDLDRFVMKHWLCAGHDSSIAKPGDFFTIEIAEESVIIVRGKDDIIRALVNVCRHRGSRVCLEKSGNATVFVCPYHAWTYYSDGRLRAARDMGPDFDRSEHGLRELPLRIVEGLIFFTFATEPLEFSPVEEMLKRVGGAYGWAQAKVAYRKTYPIAANWKLAVENYMECYHCGPSHPEFNQVHSNDQPPERVAELFAAMVAKAGALGIDLPEVDQWSTLAEPGQEAVFCSRFALFDQALSGSDGGKPVAPLMGRFTAYDGGTTYVHVGPASFFLAYPDYSVIYRFVPESVQSASMEIVWLVKGDAREGVDYDIERLTWMWQVTSEADKRIIEDNQRGVNSRYYEPGPLARMEVRQGRFVEWYFREMRLDTGGIQQRKAGSGSAPRAQSLTATSGIEATADMSA